MYERIKSLYFYTFSSLLLLDSVSTASAKQLRKKKGFILLFSLSTVEDPFHFENVVREQKEEEEEERSKDMADVFRLVIKA